MDQFFAQNGEVILRLAAAMVCGMLIGAERLFMHKEAGMKTHALVTIGAAVFVLVSESVVGIYMNFPGVNPMMIPSEIVVGIGFLGAGSIMLQGNKLKGLTTASGLWVTAGIGMAAGFGLFNLAFITTILVLLIFILMNIFENPIRVISGDTNQPKD